MTFLDKKILNSLQFHKFCLQYNILLLYLETLSLMLDTDYRLVRGKCFVILHVSQDIPLISFPLFRTHTLAHTHAHTHTPSLTYTQTDTPTHVQTINYTENSANRDFVPNFPRGHNRLQLDR